MAYMTCKWTGGSDGPKGNRAVYLSRVFGTRADFGVDAKGEQVVGITIPDELANRAALEAALTVKLRPENRAEILDGFEILGIAK